MPPRQHLKSHALWENGAVHHHGVAVTVAVPNSRTPALCSKGVVPWDRGGGAPGGAPAHQGWCTPSLAMPAQAPSLLGHIQVSTALGVAVPQDKGWRCPPEHLPLGLLCRSLPQGWRCTITRVAVPSRQQHKPSYASFSSPFFTTFANVPTLQVFHHHVQVCYHFHKHFSKVIHFSPIVH